MLLLHHEPTVLVSHASGHFRWGGNQAAGDAREDVERMLTALWPPAALRGGPGPASENRDSGLDAVRHADWLTDSRCAGCHLPGGCRRRRPYYIN